MRAQPATPTADVSEDRARFLGVRACGREPALFRCDQREGRAGEGVTRRPALRLRVLHGPERRRPGFFELPGEVERVRVAAQCRDERVVAAGFGELDCTPSGEHCTIDIAVNRGRAHHVGDGLDVHAKAVGEPLLRSVGDAEKPAALERGLPEHGRRGRRRNGQHGILEQLRVGDLTHPLKQRPRSASSDQDEVIVRQQPRDELVLARLRRVLRRFYGAAPSMEPDGRAAMDLELRGRIDRGQLEHGKLCEQRVDPVPAPCSRRETNRFARSSSASTAAESERSSTASHSSAVKRPRTDARSKNTRASAASDCSTSWVR